MPSTQFLKASLALWRRRYKFRNAKLNHWRRVYAKTNRPVDLQRVVKWNALLHAAAAMIARRESQLNPKRRLWMTGVLRTPRVSPGALNKHYPGRIVWHTTEGDSDATSTLDANADWPHFEVLRDGSIIQYLPLDHMAKALKHTDTTPTNGANCIQIEVVGHAARSHWPKVQRDACRRLARFIEANAGVPRRAGVHFVSPANAVNNKVRMDNAAWSKYTGHCGHQHVPQNDHLDPGAMWIEDILA